MLPNADVVVAVLTFLRCAAALEVLVRKMLRLPSAPAVVLLNAFSWIGAYANAARYGANHVFYAGPGGNFLQMGMVRVQRQWGEEGAFCGAAAPAQRPTTCSDCTLTRLAVLRHAGALVASGGLASLDREQAAISGGKGRPACATLVWSFVLGKRKEGRRGRGALGKRKEHGCCNNTHVLASPVAASLQTDAWRENPLNDGYPVVPEDQAEDVFFCKLLQPPRLGPPGLRLPEVMPCGRHHPCTYAAHR